jgi:hypothetical protein
MNVFDPGINLLSSPMNLRAYSVLGRASIADHEIAQLKIAALPKS